MLAFICFNDRVVSINILLTSRYLSCIIYAVHVVRYHYIPLRYTRVFKWISRNLRELLALIVVLTMFALSRNDLTHFTDMDPMESFGDSLPFEKSQEETARRYDDITRSPGNHACFDDVIACFCVHHHVCFEFRVHYCGSFMLATSLFSVGD